MKLNKLFTGALVTALTAGLLLMSTTAAAITPGSIPYEGAETSGTTFPAFNIFHGVPSVGNEADFIRVKKDGEANSTLRNSIDTACKTGDRFDVWFYVHNGAKPSLNHDGDGPGVAKNVVAKVSLPDQTGKSITGGVTASNAQAISDTATITCQGKQFKLKYVENSANAFLDLVNKTVPLPKAFVEGGTPIGSLLLNGEVWGCWDQRVWMGLKVEVEEVPVEVKEPVCEMLNIVLDNRKVTVREQDVQFNLNGATLNGVRIDFGEGVVRTSFPAEHTYTTDGTKTIRATVLTSKGDVTSANCVKQVSFSSGQPPKQVPPVLPSTGAESVVGIFAATTTAGTVAHRLFNRRKHNR